MAKGQKGNRKKGPNYFENNIRAFGENFLERKTPLDIQKDAKKIFMDLEHGNIVVNRDAIYFTNVNFLINLIQVATDNYWYHAYTSAGLKQSIQSNLKGEMDPIYVKIIEKHDYATNAYAVVINYLNNMLNNKGVIINLNNMLMDLRSFRGAFSDMFIVRDDINRRMERRNGFGSNQSPSGS